MSGSPMQTVFKIETAQAPESSRQTPLDGSLSPTLSTPSATEAKRETRKRTKTGCLTCRKRRIKCDEEKPACQRCLKSKRTCEGYSTKAVFRNEGQRDYATTHLNIRPSAASNGASSSNHAVGSAGNTSAPHNTSQTSNANGPRSNYIPIVFAPHYQGPGYPDSHGSFPTAPPPQNVAAAGAGSAMLAQQLIAPGSRNSSTSTASGSSERRISVMSLISPDASNASKTATSLGGQEGGLDAKMAQKSSSRSNSTGIAGPGLNPVAHSAEADARDSYYYNYYMNTHALTLSKNNLVPEAAPALWTQTIPGLINEDPPGKRSLFDALIALTAHTRGEEVPISFEAHSSGQLANKIELGIKCLIDIFRDSTETLNRADAFFELQDEPVQRHLRWQMLHTLVVCNLADARTRTHWVHYLAEKAFVRGLMPATTEAQHFFLTCLRELSYNGGVVPRQPSNALLGFRSKYEFLAIPGMDLIYFAMCQDYTALRGICYRILSSPRAEYLLLAGSLLRGAQLRSEPGLDTLLADLHRAADKVPY